MENNTTPMPPQPAGQPVMDIQPPRPVAAATPSAPGVPQAASANDPTGWSAAPASAPAPVAEPVPAPADSFDSIVPAPSADIATPAATPSAPESQSAPEAANPMAITTQPAKRKAPIGAIVGAIVVAILLAAAAVFAYMKTKNSSSASHGAAKVSKITSSDVAQTSSQLDSSLNTIDDTKDFGANDLSDTALGL